MDVSSILKRKGTNVETIDARSCLEEAARRLTTAGIGSLVVLDEENSLLGVLSEREIVRALARNGRSVGSIACGAAVDEAPATCGPEDTLREVMILMTRKRTRHIPVLVGRTIVGIVSIGDIVKGQLDDLELEVGVLRDYSRMRR